MDLCVRTGPPRMPTCARTKDEMKEGKERKSLSHGELL